MIIVESSLLQHLNVSAVPFLSSRERRTTPKYDITSLERKERVLIKDIRQVVYCWEVTAWVPLSCIVITRFWPPLLLSIPTFVTRILS